MLKNSAFAVTETNFFHKITLFKPEKKSDSNNILTLSCTAKETIMMLKQSTDRYSLKNNSTTCQDNKEFSVQQKLHSNKRYWHSKQYYQAFAVLLSTFCYHLVWQYNK